MKASVWANKFEEGQERARKGQENIPGDHIEGKTTQKQNIDITPIQKGIVDFLLHHPYAGRKEISSIHN